MQLYIPALGDKLELAEDWTFILYGESRNSMFINRYHDKTYNAWSSGCVSWLHTLPASTILKVARIYIRTTKKDYDSITFSIVSSPCKQKGRFWVKLVDANTIQFT